MLENVERLEVTLDVYYEVLKRVKKHKKNQILYIWDIMPDTYNYVICDATDAVPDIVTTPAIQRTFIYKEPIL
jgi:hypothetical protein